jgi:hypothetical protein
MFSEAAGIQINGGNFFDINGDGTLQTHHPMRIQDQHAAFHPLAGSALEIDDGRATGSYKPPSIQDQELHAASFQHQAPADTTLGPENSERAGAGFARNWCLMAADPPKIYGALEFA